VPLNEPAGAIAASMGELTLLIGLDETVIAGPGPDPGVTELLPHPEVVRVHNRFDSGGHYRPLSGLRNLPRDWHVRLPNLEAFSAALDAIYPLAQTHIAAHAGGTLEVVTLDEVFARQEGRYRVAAQLSEGGRALVRRALCASCVRVPFWAGERHLPEGGIPCPEPCSVVLSLCREAALWETERPESVPPDPSIPFAAFEEPGNPLREAFLRAMEPVHEQ
jgi:hypothetical protein